jgi:hypothetical protein
MLAGMIFAQGLSKSSVNISARLINGSMFNIAKGRLDINESSRYARGNFILKSSDGVLLRLDNFGHNNNSSSNGNSEIQFLTIYKKIEDPSDDNKDKSNFQKPNSRVNVKGIKKAMEIIDMSPVIFKENRNDSLSNILVGSSLRLFNTSEHNLYSGIFVVSVIY